MIEGNVQTASQEVLPDPSLLEVKRDETHAGFWSLAVAGAARPPSTLSTSIYVSSHRLLWFDEVMTVHIARLPDWRTILSALSHGADSLPPLVLPGCQNVRQAVRTRRTRGKAAVHASDGGHSPHNLRLCPTPHRRPSRINCAGARLRPTCGRRVRSAVLRYLCHVCSPGLVGLDIHRRQRSSRRSCSERRYSWASAFITMLCCCWCRTHCGRFPAGNRGSLPRESLIAGVVGVVVPAALLSHFILSFSRKFAPGFWSRPSLRELTEIYSHIFVGGSICSRT